MTLDTTSVEVGGVEIRSTQLPARRALRLLPLIAKAVGKVAPHLDSLDMGAEADLSSLGPLLADVVGSMSPDEADSLISGLLASTVIIDGNRKYELSDPARIDLAFRGRLGLMFRAAAIAFRCNYANFFEGASNPSPEPSPEESA